MCSYLSLSLCVCKGCGGRRYRPFSWRARADANTWSTARGIMPRWWGSATPPDGPSIVNVLPEPVWPYLSPPHIHGDPSSGQRVRRQLKTHVHRERERRWNRTRPYIHTCMQARIHTDTHTYVRHACTHAQAYIHTQSHIMCVRGGGGSAWARTQIHTHGSRRGPTAPAVRSLRTRGPAARPGRRSVRRTYTHTHRGSYICTQTYRQAHASFSDGRQ
jgi:hypothetical protein